MAAEKGSKEIQELRKRMVDILDPSVDDYELKKWLIARNFDVNKAEKMYRESHEYKKKMNVSTLLATYKMPEVIEKYFPGGFIGFDRDGSPIQVELFGRYDMEGLMKSCTRSDLERIKLYHSQVVFHLLDEQTKKLGKKVDGLTVIFDMEGVSAKFLWKPGLDMYLDMVKVLEDNYPEMLKRLCVINAPAVFPILWRMTRPMLSSYMRKKIFVFDANFKEHLLKFIDADNLPAYLGGNLTDPDGNSRCVTKICQGGPIPEACYLEKSSEHDMKSVTINNGSKFTDDVIVDKPGIILCWQFRTKSHDIGFEITCLESPGAKDGKVVVPYKRFNAEVITEDGTHACKDTGTYRFVFDNSYSWKKPKILSYRIWTIEDVHSPGDELDTFLEDFQVASARLPGAPST